MSEITEEMVDVGTQHYSEGGYCGLADHERIEVVRNILKAAAAPVLAAKEAEIKRQQDIVSSSEQERYKDAGVLVAKDSEIARLRRELKVFVDFQEEIMEVIPSSLKLTMEYAFSTSISALTQPDAKSGEDNA